MKAEDIDLVGLRLDDIEFLERLGRGGYGTVYHGIQVAYYGISPRHVAVKVFIVKTEDREETSKEFEKWSRDLQPLIDLSKFAGIVQYHKTYIEEIVVNAEGKAALGGSNARHGDETFTGFFIVMEYADGGAMGELYRQKVMVERKPQIFLSHFIDVCMGLKHAHQHGIVHNDIKPDNLLWFKEADRVNIADFGIASYRDKTFPGDALYLKGSLRYMSPESFEYSARSDERRDIYALGCTFYELLTGQPAFTLSPKTLAKAVDDVAIRDAFYNLHRQAPRPNAKQYNKDLVSFSLNSCLKLMMDPLPDNRPSLDRVMHELEAQKKRFEIDSVSATGDAMKSKPSREPKMGVLNLVNPDVREQLGEQLFFLFITFSGYTEHKLTKLLSYLDSYFGCAYSFFELYGKYDFVIRVWCNKNGQRLREFCDRVLKELLDDNNDLLNVVACEKVNYLNVRPRKVGRPDVKELEWLSTIYEAQKEDAQSVRFLEQNGVYVRKIPKLDPKKCVKSFTLVQSLAQNAYEREAQHVLLLKNMQDLKVEKTDLRFAVYKTSVEQVRPLNRAPCDFIISYVSKTFHDVAVVPEWILEKIPGYRYRTTTLLATGRYFIFSDGVNVDGGESRS